MSAHSLAESPCTSRVESDCLPSLWLGRSPHAGPGDICKKGRLFKAASVVLHRVRQQAVSLGGEGGGGGGHPSGWPSFLNALFKLRVVVGECGG